MTARFRHWLLLCLIALALPVQSLAAARMLHCGGGQPAGLGAAVGAAHHGDVALPGETHGHAGHPVALGTATEVPVGHHAQAMDHTAAPAQADAPHLSPHHGCSACAACCVALALPQAHRPWASLPAVPVQADEPVVPDARFETTGPDRPPRRRH